MRADWKPQSSKRTDRGNGRESSSLQKGRRAESRSTAAWSSKIGTEIDVYKTGRRAEKRSHGESVNAEQAHRPVHVDAVSLKQAIEVMMS